MDSDLNDILRQINTKKNQIERFLNGTYISLEKYILEKIPIDEYTYDYGVNYEGIKTLADELMNISPSDDSVKNNKYEFYHTFYTTVLIYLYRNCNQDDWIFDSFLKLADTVEKESKEEESTFDIIISTTDNGSTNEPSYKSMIEHYNSFNELFDDCYDKSFYDNVKKTIYEYLKDKSIYYDYDKANEICMLYEMVEKKVVKALVRIDERDWQ